jgi:hypothetical protein
MKQLIPHANFSNFIFEFRDNKVMIDADLSTMYEIETKRLKAQVRRNKSRFPKDFMFELTAKEKTELVKLEPRFENLKYSPVTPMVFTEQGVAMLSSVLNSKKAIEINIEIMRAFAQYRALLLENKDLKKQIKLLDLKLNKAFQFLLTKIDALAPQVTERKKIGYKISNEEK